MSADQQEAEAVKRTVAMEEREVKNMQKEIQVCACVHMCGASPADVCAVRAQFMCVMGVHGGHRQRE